MTDASATAPPPPDPYRPSLGLIQALTIFFILGIVLDAANGCLSLIEGSFFPNLASAETVESASEAVFAVGSAVGALLAVLVFLTTAVLYCAWIYRSNKNVRALGAKGLRFTPGWCVGWFFVPIMCLFRPFQAVKEIYRAASPEAGAEDWGEVPVPPLIGWWWGLWILSTFASQLEFRMSLNKNPAIVALSPWAGAAASFIDIPTGILALLVVLRINSRMQEKARGQAGLNPKARPI